MAAVRLSLPMDFVETVLPLYMVLRMLQRHNQCLSKSLSAIVSSVLMATALSSTAAVCAKENCGFSFFGANAQENQQGKSEAKKESLKTAARSSIVIKAPPEAVWSSMLEQRKHDPELKYSKVLAVGRPSTVEQKYVFPSLFGTATCVINLVEHPGQRIDYKLVSSEDFKTWEGSWIITPGPNGETKLELSSFIELDAPIPRRILNMMVETKLKRNLAVVKNLAERQQLASVSRRTL